MILSKKMPHSLVLSFKEDISTVEESNELCGLRSTNYQLHLGRLSPGLHHVITTLCDRGATEPELSNFILKTDGASFLPQLYYHLQQFINLGFICHTVEIEATSIATLIPITTPYHFFYRQAAVDLKYILSRFAYSHCQDNRAIWESPLSHAQLIISDWRAAMMMHQLSQPQECHSLSQLPGISLDTAQRFLTLLLNANLISEVTKDSQTTEEKNEILTQWEFHDLLFHSRSRSGRHNHPVGKSYRFLGKIKPTPAVKHKLSDRVIPLYKPNLQQLQQTDRSFTQVLEERKSIRVHNKRSIGDRELGEFLYRCARIRNIVPREHLECSDRPYPSGGASYELELYLAIDRSENITSGLYHYDPQEHQLEQIIDREASLKENRNLDALLENAQKANGEDSVPQILIILTARFARVSWAYESIAYSLILKHVGVLYQTMYLVATAMNLAPCALGSGNSDLFAAITGINYCSESSVGEFMLGT